MCPKLEGHEILMKNIIQLPLLPTFHILLFCELIYIMTIKKCYTFTCSNENTMKNINNLCEKEEL